MAVRRISVYTSIDCYAKMFPGATFLFHLSAATLFWRYWQSINAVRVMMKGNRSSRRSAAPSNRTTVRLSHVVPQRTACAANLSVTTISFDGGAPRNNGRQNEIDRSGSTCALNHPNVPAAVFQNMKVVTHLRARDRLCLREEVYTGNRLRARRR